MMATISMDDAGSSGLFLSPALARPPTIDPHVYPAFGDAVRRSHKASSHLYAVRASADTARGKPPPVSARMIVGLQWALFAACAVRILLLAP